MKNLTILAAVIAALAFASATPADANNKKGAGTRTCDTGDVLVKHNDKLHCFSKDRVPKGAVVVKQDERRSVAPAARSAVAPAPVFAIADWARKAEACLAEANVLSENSDQPGCFAGKNGQVHCTGDTFEATAIACAKKGNAAGRPPRWDQ